jgi:hypothetical protein
MVAKGRLSGGQLTSFGLYSGMVALGSSGLAGVYGDVLKFLGASKRIFKVLGSVDERNSERSVLDESNSERCVLDGSFPVATAVEIDVPVATAVRISTVFEPKVDLDHLGKSASAAPVSSNGLPFQRGLDVEFHGVQFTYPGRRYVCVGMCMYVCMYRCIYVCMYVYV